VKRPRPYIPLAVRVKVAERQVAERCPAFWVLYKHRIALPMPYPLKDRLDALLYQLFGNEAAHLDHDPALILRTIDPDGNYHPPANDPNHLVYRTQREHLEKTIGRKADAEKTVTTIGSDIWLKTKFAKRDRPEKRKQKIPSRPFPKAKRPFPKRSFRNV